MTKTDVKPLNCFISYARADSGLASEIADALRSSSNCKVFTDDELHAGEDWHRRTEDQVKDSDVFVVVVSPAALSSKSVRDEWASIQQRAWESDNVNILPVFVDRTDAPPFLKRWPRIDASDRTPSDIKVDVSDILKRLGTHQLKDARAPIPADEAFERENRFRGLIDSVSKDDDFF